MTHIYEYAIQFSNGTYYSGRAGEAYQTRIPMDVFTYTEAGAHAKIARMGWNATVIRFH